MTKIFIDGQVGTTGLQIFDMLHTRDDIEVLSIPDNKRKDPEVRKELITASEISILCLPDDAAREAVSLNADESRIIDASTAHRTNDDWVYGLPEMSQAQREAIKDAKLLSNPGCYPQGFILLVKPLIEESLLNPDTNLVCSAVSGYSGGGRQMIETFEARQQKDTDKLAVQDYGLTLNHKHVPEMQKYTGLSRAPIFLPSVANYYKGMIVRVPIAMELLNQGSANKVASCLKQKYEHNPFIRIYDCNDQNALEDGRLNAVACNGTNFMDLMIFGNAQQIVLMARYDNLGKGAAGAAIQNLNLMLGFDEETGL